MHSAIDKSGFRLRLLPLMLRYHSVGAAKRRTTAESLEGAYGSLGSLEGDLAEIRDLFHSVLDNQGPQVTALIPAYPEEVELDPTLLVSCRHLESHPDCMATSTGIINEHQVPLRRLLRKQRLIAQGWPPYSCWAGPNQFIRKRALLAVGGIDLAVEGGDDHHRIFKLVRFGKERGMCVQSADTDRSLFAPVLKTDRLGSTLVWMLRNLVQEHRKLACATGRFGLPVHPKGGRHKHLFRRKLGWARSNR